MQDYKNRVEAILFTTGRFMDTEELSRLTGLGSIGMLKEAIAELRKDYDSSPGSLAIIEENGRYKLNIKKEYSYLTTKLLSDCELDKPTQETLAIIAYKNPITQSDIVKIRGTKSYDHVKFLRENEFITSERYGRTRLLKLAPKFFEYFDVVEESLKSQFGEIAGKYAEEQQETLGEQPESPAEPETDAPIQMPEDIPHPPDEEPSEDNPEDEDLN